MGPAVSRPDDQVVGTTAVQTLTKLQWGRPFHGRMTHSGSGWPNALFLLQWGRPFHGRMT